MMLGYEYFDIICHLDLPKKFGGNLSPSFDDRLADLLSKTAGRNLAIEVNTSGYDHAAAEAYPSPHILATLNQTGIAVTIGSDAHRPEEIGRHFGRATEMLQSAGIGHLTVFTARRPSQVPIPPCRFPSKRLPPSRNALP